MLDRLDDTESLEARSDIFTSHPPPASLSLANPVIPRGGHINSYVTEPIIVSQYPQHKFLSKKVMSVFMN